MVSPFGIAAAGTAIVDIRNSDCKRSPCVAGDATLEVAAPSRIAATNRHRPPIPTSPLLDSDSHSFPTRTTRSGVGHTLMFEVHSTPSTLTTT